MSKLQNFFSKSNSESDAVKIEWKDINYSVLTKDPKKSTLLRPVYNNKKVLDNVSGVARSGELLAIMGPTGCGKTSLLNCLAARMPSGGSKNIKFTGEIDINNVPRDDFRFRKMSAYVLQDDKLYAHLTVFETLMLAAHFYLPSSCPDEEKTELVMAIITELGLIKAKDTIIGDERVRGVSGGERKRCNIAVQLISNPAVLFLDEPTSGLDSFQALSVMESMKAMALNGRLVISVIHQPRSSIFDMFDKLLLLSSGRTMYMGDAIGAAAWFSDLGHPCPKLFNPSDYYLDILSPDNRTPELDKLSAERIALLGDAWIVHAQKLAQSTNLTSPPKTPKSMLAAVGQSMSNMMNETQSVTQYDCMRQYRNFKLLSWRSFSESLRNKQVLLAKIIVTSFFACLTAGMYNSSKNDQEGILNRTGLIFIVTINMAFNSSTGVITSFPKEKVIVNRERAANAYDSFSYFLAKYVTEIPFNVIPPLLFSCIMYYIVGLNPATFGYFLMITMLEALTGVALGLWISAMTPNIEAANALGPPMVIIALIFGGFYINLATLPIVANWIPYMSLIRWAFEALCVNEFTGQTFSCSGGATGACQKTGEQVLERLSFGGHNTEYAVFGLSMLLVSFLTLAYIFLYLSKGSFLPLGHIGGNQKKKASKSTASTATTTTTAANSK